IEVEVKDDGRTVRYNGKTYRFNENRTNILCIGMDKTKTGEEALIGLRGQADTLVLVSIDMKTGQVDAIPISRNTIVGIRQYDPDGNFAGMKNTQICLAYGFGKDDAASCENVVDAVSRLFYGLPINTYFCMDLSAIAILNDAVGGVTVTTPCEVPFDAEHPLPAGSTIHLNGKQARLFVQYRDTSKIDSNQERMKRQECYLTAFFQAAMAATKEDIQVPIRLYNAVSANSTTTLNPSRITALATTLVSKNAQLQFHSLNGENTEIVQGDDGYVEYHPDDIAMYETFLKVFYTPVS
ncbi:MAG: LCP family protein, partial [Clostridia bacterium]|nr:LCP family protein [Clostridia bacterium]